MAHNIHKFVLFDPDESYKFETESLVLAFNFLKLIHIDISDIEFYSIWMLAEPNYIKRIDDPENGNSVFFKYVIL